MNESIFLEIKNIIMKKTEHKDIDLFTKIDQYPFDDLDRVMIEMGIEDCFHIDLTKHDKKLKEVETIYDLVKLVEKTIFVH
jgi:acyl carrier protein